MSIFAEYGGRSSYYTANELDRLQNPEKYNYTQEQYDAFSSQVQKKSLMPDKPLMTPRKMLSPLATWAAARGQRTLLLVLPDTVDTLAVVQPET